jgi:hypothetical protein
VPTLFDYFKEKNANITQEICIFYKFVGLLDELHIIPPKRQATFPEKVRAVCGICVVGRA